MGNQVIIFSCLEGHADRGGTVTDSQLFCLFDSSGNLDDRTCDTTNPSGNQLFTIVPQRKLDNSLITLNPFFHVAYGSAAVK
ncbi:hypothetical protein BDP27DRAFT_1429412 [Rhodocollybia butyracea]|uniref:Uncharacterized protein n=1 Tax=Rhodocollybia butyracea TaxID=206335 RepID=A0A9P5PCM5_9AGAR|nr:hypothetical protein BDP27DRAFT_1429412 [Rhodocollybia butyracea]